MRYSSRPGRSRGQRIEPCPEPEKKGALPRTSPPPSLEEALKSVARHEGAGPGGARGATRRSRSIPPAPDLAAEVKRLEGELAAEHDRLLRTAADLENFRKRVAREREEAARNAAGPVVKDLLPPSTTWSGRSPRRLAGDPLADGVRMVLRQVEEALAAPRRRAAGARWASPSTRPCTRRSPRCRPREPIAGDGGGAARAGLDAPRAAAPPGHGGGGGGPVPPADGAGG